MEQVWRAREGCGMAIVRESLLAWEGPESGWRQRGAQGKYFPLDLKKRMKDASTQEGKMCYSELIFNLEIAEFQENWSAPTMHNKDKPAIH